MTASVTAALVPTPAPAPAASAAATPESKVPAPTALATATPGIERALPLGLGGPGKQAQQAQAEALGVLGGVQGNRVFARAGHAEVVGGAADGNHQGAVGNAARGEDLLAIAGGGDRPHAEGLAGGIERRHGAVDEGEAAVVGQHLVRQALLVDVQGAGRDLVQRGLPDMVEPAIHQHHLRRAQLAPQFAGQFQPARSASYDHDLALQACLRG
jgi:hypothetical protein